MRDIITAYTFDKTAKTITLTDITPVVAERVLGIWNATRGVKYYDPHTTGYGATFATNVITLVDATTSAHANTDDLIIFYEGEASTYGASQTTAAAILAKLTADPATQTTLAALLAKVIAAPSTEAKQDVLNAKDFATQTTLAALLAKVIAAPATEAKQDTLIAKDFATQTTLAALLTELALKADLTENQPVKHSGVATYALSTATFTPAASATDIFIINGSASKTVRVLRVIVSGTQTTAGNVANFSLIKRSAANSGGTAVSATLVPLDSNSGAATATASHYTANPTPGAAVGTIYNPRVTLWAPATASATATVLDFNSQDLLNGTPVTLHGTAQGLAVNLGGTTASGSANHTITCIWTEE